MGKAEKDDSIEVKFGGARVLVKQRPGDGLWVARWRLAGKGCNTTARTKEGILKLAGKKVRELSRQQGGRVMTAEDAELVERLKKIAGERSPFSLLSQIERACAKLGGWDFLERAVQHYEKSGMAQVDRVSIADAKNKFLRLYKADQVYTVAGLRKELDGLVKVHPTMDVCDLTEDFLQAWVDRGDPGPVFQNNRIDTWRTFLNKCRKWNYWPKGEKHPAELVERAVEPDKIPEIFTVEQAQKILDSVPLKRIPYVVIGGWLGLRPTEMTRIFWERDWDWERRYLHVPPDVARKTMRERYVPIPDAAYEMLAPWRGAKGKCCLTHDREYISKDLRDAGVIEEWPQDVLRHSSISYRIAKGDSIGLVAEHHGNSETEIRQSYRRPLRKEDGEAWFSLRRTVDNGAHVRANSNGTGETL